MTKARKDGRRGRGGDFEDLIRQTFRGYSARQIARLDMMPCPTRIVGRSQGRPVMVLAGKPPFDVYGYRLQDGRMIGAELKSSDRKPSLPLVGPGKKGDGLQFHQIDALAGLVQAGGYGFIVWDNGGEIGVLTGSAITTAHRTFEHAWASEEAGKSAPRGSKSIPWDRFATEVTWNEAGPDWLLLT
jgi:penicillin-binding protein-related factor A (putative recombinase)